MGIAGGIGLAGTPAIALLAMIVIAVALCLSRRLGLDLAPRPSMQLPLRLERPG